MLFFPFQVTFSQLQGLQSGQPGSALLLKTENGQYQLLRVGPAPGAPVTTNLGNTNPTLRLQSVPAVSRFTGPPLALRKTIVTQQQVKQKQNVNRFFFFSFLFVVVSSFIFVDSFFRTVLDFAWKFYLIFLFTQKNEIFMVLHPT